MDCEPSSFMSTLHKKQSANLEKAMKKGAVGIVLSRQPSICKKCGEIFAQPVVSYSLDGAEYKLNGFCSKCSSDKFEIIGDTAFCPECKSEIVIRYVGKWD